LKQESVMTVELTESEWNQVMGILSQAPWNLANPLLMRIGQQLQPQKAAAMAAPVDGLDAAARERH
jgi:hypothetical protein